MDTGQDPARQHSGCLGPRRGKSGCNQRRPSGMDEGGGGIQWGCGGVTGGGGDRTSGAPVRAPPPAARTESGGRGGGGGSGGGGVCWREGRGGERKGVAPGAGGECYVGAAPPEPSPPRGDGQTGGGGAGRRVGGSRGAGGEGGKGRREAGRPGLPHLPASPPPPARPPRSAIWGGGERAATRPSLCRAGGAGRGRGRGFVLAGPGWGPGDGGIQAGAPPPRTRSPQLPGARARRRRRLQLRPPGLPPGPRPGGGRRSPSPGPEPPPIAPRAGGRRGPLAIRPGAPWARAPPHSLRCRGGRPAGRSWGAAGVGGGEGSGGCWVSGSESRPPPAACAPPLPPRGPGDGWPAAGGWGATPRTPKGALGSRAFSPSRRSEEGRLGGGTWGLPSPSRPGRGGELGTWKGPCRAGRPPCPPRPPSEVGEPGTSHGAGPARGLQSGRPLAGL